MQNDLDFLRSGASRALPVAGAAGILAAGYVISAGSMLADAATMLLVVAPLLAYAVLSWPMYVPFAIYVLLVPFDNLLVTGAGGTVTKFLGIASGIAAVLWMVRVRRARWHREDALILCLLLAWMSASTFWSLDERTAVTSLAQYAGLFALYLALAMFPVTRAQFLTIVACVIVGAVVAAAYGAHTFYTHPPSDETAGRLVLTAGETSIDPNAFSDALLLPSALLIVWALRTSSILAKLGALAALTVLALAIVFSGSREALIGFGIVVAYIFVRSRYRLAMIAPIVALFAFLVGAQSTLWTRFATVFQTGGSGRASIWSVGAAAAREHLVQGYGIGNFQNAYDLFYLSTYQAYPYGFSSPAHNLIVRYLVELGVPGLLLVLWFFVNAFRSLRTIKASSEYYDYRIALEAGVLAIAFVSLTIDLFTYKYAWLVFITLALLRTAATEQRQDAMDERAPQPVARSVA